MGTRAPLIVLVAALLTSAAGASAAGSPSGVDGTVTRGPITPVCRERVPCSAPAGGVTLGFLRSGMVVARVTSKRDGTFRIALAPGSYGIRWLRNPAVGVLRPRVVQVQSGRFTNVKLVIDAGIRSVSGG